MKTVLSIVLFALTVTCSYAQPQLWGLTAKGGTDSSGNIFKIKGDGTGFQSVHSFTGMINKGSNPSLLCEGSVPNKVYGIANAGGANGLGTLFSYDYTTNVCTVLKQLDSTTGFNCKGGLTMNFYNNKLYGLMKQGGSNNGGTLVEYNETTNNFAVLLNFESFTNGIEPVGALTAVGSMMYGCTSQGTSSSLGGVFSYDLSQPPSSSFAQVFNFSTIPNTGYETDGFIAKSFSGKLYVCTKKDLQPPALNTTQGALLQIDPNNGNTVLPLVYFDASLQGYGAGNLLYIYDGNEKLIGLLSSGGALGAGSVFELNLTASSFSIKYNFSFSNNEGYGFGGRLSYNNLNYILGFTRYGGAFGDGTLYKYNLNTATVDTMMSLQNNITGNTNSDEGGLLYLPSANKWIGSLQNGVAASGNIVELNYPISNQLATLASFNVAPNGLYPQASLIEKDGYLYGTTVQGGNSASGTHSSYGDYIGYGTMFKYHPQTNVFTKLIDFNDVNGSFPSSDLYADNWGSIYGTTMYGGASGLGTVFKYDIGSNSLQTMYEFSIFGANPIAGVAEYNGQLYGVTNKGGIGDAGILYSIQPGSNVFNVLHLFDTTVEGGRPIGKLFLASNNKFYGFTSMGSSNGVGGIFQFDPATNIFSFIVALDSTNTGANAHGSFTELNNKLYATITNGGSATGEGVFLEYDFLANSITQNLPTSGHPKGTPLKASSNNLYWLASDGGTNNKGSIISYNTSGNTFADVGYFDGSNGAHPALSSLTEYALCPTVNPPVSIHGIAPNFCEATTQVFYADTVTTAQSFNWTVPADWNIISGQGTDTIHVTIGASSGNIEVNVYDGCSTSANTSFFQGVTPLPSIPAAISGGAANVCPSVSQSYSTFDNGGADSFTWIVPSGWQVVNGQGTANVTLTTNSVAANDTIKVKGNNVCGSSAYTIKAVHVYPTTPAQPGVITGNASPCNGSNTYSIAPVDGASSYEWTIPSGWTYIANSNINSIIVNANENAGNITVKAVGSCNGSKSLAQTLTITRPTLAMPERIVGDSIVCVNTNVTFSVPAVPGANSYFWDVPVNWIIISGQNTNSITIKPNNQAILGFLKVFAKSNCAFTSKERTKTIYPDGHFLHMPNISGKQTVQLNNVYTYTALPMAYASSYNWAVPSGWNIVSGQGTTQVQVQAGSTKGYIKFMASKSCNITDTALLPIEITQPTNPSTPVFVGVTSATTDNRGGSLFTIGADSSGFNVLHPFADSIFLNVELNTGYGGKNNLVKATNGKLYGHFINNNNQSVIAEYDPATGILLPKIYSETIFMQAMVASTDGYIYTASLNSGVSFGRYNPANNSMVLLKPVLFNDNKTLQVISFMQASNSKFYGLASTNDSLITNGEEIFEFDIATNNYKTLYRFNDTANGLKAFGRLVQHPNGLLYGITTSGGTGNHGTIYSFNVITNAFTKLHDLCCVHDFSFEYPTIASNGKLYSSASGMLFEFNIATNTYTPLQQIDGFNGALVEPVSGKLYGITEFPTGANGRMIFEYDINTGTYTPKVQLATGTNNLGDGFFNICDGGNGKLYGSTRIGAQGGTGAFYEYTIASNSIQPKFSYGFKNGRKPVGALVRANNGKFYGTTAGDRVGVGYAFYGYGYGAGYMGSLFEYDPIAQTASKKHDFNNAEGYPVGSMVLASNCKLYGLATGLDGGNTAGNSQIFEFNPATDEFAVKIPATSSFSPLGSMIEYKPGKLLGLSQTGIFEYDVYNSILSTKYNFASDSYGYYYPVGALTKAANGKIYGVCQRGFSQNFTEAFIFEFNPQSNALTVLQVIPGGYCKANGSLIEGAYGKLYGVFYDHPSYAGIITGNGGIFEYDYLTNSYAFKKIFPYYENTGDSPYGISLVKGSNGKLYGMNSTNHYSNTALNGTVYEYDPTTNDIKTIKLFNGFNGTNPQITSLTEINPITASTIYYSKATGNLNDINTWGMNTDGTGTAPANFISDNKVFIITNNSSKTINSNWSISGFNTKVYVGNGTDSTTLIVPDGFTLTVTDKAILEVNNKGNILIAANAVLEVNNNATVNCNCNSNLTFRSSAAGTARLAPLANGGYVYGNVKTERYIQGGYRKFRFLGHPFAYPMSIYEWTDDIDITGTISGTNANCFTTTGSNNPSAFTFTEANGNGASNDAGWNALSSSSIASQLGIAQGIRVLIRGSKNQAGSLTGGTYLPNPVTLNMKGILQQGDLTKQLSYSGNGVGKGWNLIGNPYPSNIDWNTVTKTNVNDAVYTYRPSLNGGTYASYINGSSTNGGSNILESHVGFFVRANNTGASLTFHENDKVATAQPNTMFRNSNTQNQINSKLLLRLVADSLQYTDEVVVRFGIDKATDDFDEEFDAYNLAGNAHDLYALDAKENKYSIYHGSELKPWQDEDREIKLGISVPVKGIYNLQGKLLNEMANGNIAFLKDAELNTLTAITDSINYSFSINNNQLLVNNNRFSIVFNPKEKTIVPTTGLTLTPNPSTGNMFVLSTRKAYKQLSIQLNDASGKTIFVQETKGINSNQSITIQTPTLAAGTYYITAISEYGKEMFTWIKL